MKTNVWKILWWITFTVAFISFWIILSTYNPEGSKSRNFDKGYRQGQIDALNGIQNYDKTIKKDTIYFKIK